MRERENEGLGGESQWTNSMYSSEGLREQASTRRVWTVLSPWFNSHRSHALPACFSSPWKSDRKRRHHHQTRGHPTLCNRWRCLLGTGGIIIPALHSSKQCYSCFWHNSNLPFVWRNTNCGVVITSACVCYWVFHRLPWTLGPESITQKVTAHAMTTKQQSLTPCSLPPRTIGTGQKSTHYICWSVWACYQF